MSEPVHFVETLEYRRFAEFCEACRRYRYIGLCYGPPGVGKTLSARHYARWDAIKNVDVYKILEDALLAMCKDGNPDTVFCTASVVSTPKSVEEEIAKARKLLHRIACEPLRREQKAVFEKEETEYERRKEEYFSKTDWRNITHDTAPPLPEKPQYDALAASFMLREQAIVDPTSLVLIDEADRLKMPGLETVRDIFDRSQVGVILIGMPGVEKRLARYPQFYSRVGFVHEFRPLNATEVRRLLTDAWTPPGVHLPSMDDETISTVVRITGGNFRLINRLLSQTERILEINQLSTVTRQAVETARESLVIGQSI